MSDREREPPDIAGDSRLRIAHRILNLMLASSLLALACSNPDARPSSESTPTASSDIQRDPQRDLCYGDSVRGGGYFEDLDLRPNLSSIIRSIEFCFNRGRNDSVALRLCFTGNRGEFRITSKQVSQGRYSDPGYLFNRPFDAPGEGCRVYSPVIKVEPDEVDQVNIGERKPSEPYDATYTGRAYRTTRLGDLWTITVEPLGTQTLNPDTVIPRSPDEPAEYFKR